jgi:hypothetical protein
LSKERPNLQPDALRAGVVRASGDQGHNRTKPKMSRQESNQAFAFLYLFIALAFMLKGASDWSIDRYLR